MKRASINFLLILAASLLAISVQSRAGDSYPYPYPNPPQSPMCQRLRQLCGYNNGPYSCCPGLQCIVPPRGVGGGLCVPRLSPPIDQVATMAGLTQKPSRKCQEFGDACIPYGNYACCKYGGLECMTTPKVPGFGVCATAGTPIMPLINAIFGGPRRCQEEGQVCLSYGPYTCCRKKRLYCHVVKEALGIGFCTPF